MSNSGYQQLITAILVKIRRKSSQAHLSSKLGLQHNHVYKWESGQRKIQWLNFIELVSLQGIDLKPLFFELYNYEGNLKDSKKLTEHIFMNISSKTVSKLLGTSTYRVESWRNNKGLFYLADMLVILDLFSKYLVDFSRIFLTLDEIEKAEISIREYKLREFEIENPFVSLIFRLLETETFKNKEDTLVSLCEVLDAEKEVIKGLLDQSEHLGFLKRVNEKYIATSTDIDIRGKKALRGRQFWVEKSLEHIRQGKVSPPDNIFGNLIYCIDDVGHKKILDAYLAFFENVRAITNENKGNNAFVMNTQFLRMSGSSSKQS